MLEKLFPELTPEDAAELLIQKGLSRLAGTHPKERGSRN